MAMIVLNTVICEAKNQPNWSHRRHSLVASSKVQQLVSVAKGVPAYMQWFLLLRGIPQQSPTSPLGPLQFLVMEQKEQYQSRIFFQGCCGEILWGLRLARRQVVRLGWKWLRGMRCARATARCGMGNRSSNLCSANLRKGRQRPAGQSRLGSGDRWHLRSW